MAPPQIVGEEIVVTGVDPVLATFDLVTGRAIGTYAVEPPALAAGAALPVAAVERGGVHTVLVLRDGRVVGLRFSRTAQ